MNDASLSAPFRVQFYYPSDDPPTLILTMVKNNIHIRLYYEFVHGHWIDYHTPPTRLTDKTAIQIHLQIRNNNGYCHYDKLPYNIAKTLLLKQLCDQHLVDDVFHLIFDHMD